MTVDCTLCGEPVHSSDGRTTHPCCSTWARINPGQPCQGCLESRRAGHGQRRRRGVRIHDKETG